jgi:hypothetical protein
LSWLNRLKHDLPAAVELACGLGYQGSRVEAPQDAWRPHAAGAGFRPPGVHAASVGRGQYAIDVTVGLPGGDDAALGEIDQPDLILANARRTCQFSEGQHRPIDIQVAIVGSEFHPRKLELFTAGERIGASRLAEREREIEGALDAQALDIDQHDG